MKHTIIAVASALLLAVAVTELSRRIWPDSGLALLLLSFGALLINGLFSARQAAGSAAGNIDRDRRGKRGDQPRGKRPQSEGRNGNNRNSEGRNRGGRNRQGNARNDRDRNKPAADKGANTAASAGAAGAVSAASSKTNSDPAPAADGPREEGTVKWFNRSKGFGFVVRPNGDEIFVHQRSIRSAEGQGRPVLKDGEQVSFVVAERERGMQAEDVVPVRAG